MKLIPFLLVASLLLTACNLGAAKDDLHTSAPSIVVGTECDEDGHVLTPGTAFGNTKELCYHLTGINPKVGEIRTVVAALQTTKWNNQVIYERKRQVTNELEYLNFELKSKNNWPVGSYLIQAFADETELIMMEYKIVD